VFTPCHITHQCVCAAGILVRRCRVPMYFLSVASCHIVKPLEVPGSSWSSKSARISISITPYHILSHRHIPHAHCSSLAATSCPCRPCPYCLFFSHLQFNVSWEKHQEYLSIITHIITSHHITLSRYSMITYHIITSHHQCTWLLWLGLRVLRVPLFYWLSVYLSGRSSEPPCGCGVAHWNEIRRLISIYRTSLIIVLLCAAVCWLVSACPFRVVVHFFYFPVIPNLRQAKPNHQTSTMLLKKYLSI
jgi:hypothetical protein